MIRDIKANSSIKIQALVVKINQGVASNGAAYLSLTLQDKTGLIDGRIWNASKDDIENLQVGKLIELEANALEYKEVLQLKINHYQLITLTVQNSPNFIESAPEMDSLFDQIKKYLDKIVDQDLKMIVSKILEINEKQFINSYAAVRHHHNVLGGLMWHTLTMLKTAESICKVYEDRNINRDLLYAGIILHDMGKTEELRGYITPEYSLKGKLIGHISITSGQIAHVAETLKIKSDKAVLLQHMVLASHGKNEYGSPVLPQILEAEILHHIDNLDARIYSLSKNLSNVSYQNYTTRISGLENRSFYQHCNKNNKGKD